MIAILGITHIVIGVTATSVLLQTADPVPIFIGAIASLLPDVDTSNSPAGQVLWFASRWLEKRFPHRSCTHSFAASFVVASITYPVVIWFHLPLEIAHAVNIGYFAGWFADLFTQAGVEMFYPSSVRWVMPSNRNFRLRTNSPAEHGLLVVLIAIAIASFSINAKGGILTQFNRLIATPTGVEQLYNKKGADYLMIAHIKGVRAIDREPMQGDFWIIQAHSQGFIVQGWDGGIYKVGTEPDSQIIAEHITADAGPVANTTIDALELQEEQVFAKLKKFNRRGATVFVSGEMAIDDPEGVYLRRDPRQFPTIRRAGASVTLEAAPLATVQKKLGGQFATGELSIRTIYAKTTSANSFKP